MITSLAQQPVGELVRRRSSRARIFERFGIDYCCGGQKTLAQACAAAGVSVDEVAGDLEACDAAPPPADCEDWTAASLSDLIDHIVTRHHRFLVSELPGLEALIDKVVGAHSRRHPELLELRKIFSALGQELCAHMGKEEQILFPLVKRLEQAAAADAPPPSFHCGSVNNPIAMMEDEHAHAGEALRRLRWLTGGFRPPEDACPAYEHMLQRLANLETDLHQHIHKENNILFPEAAHLEAFLRQKVAR